MFAQRARDNLACVAFCGLVGGQDELVFDGHSCVIDHTGAHDRPRGPVPRGAARVRRRPRRRRGRAPARPQPPARGPPRRAASACVLPPLPRARPAGPPASAAPARLAEPLAPVEAEVYAALTLGLRDYVDKNGFGTSCSALSGGIDSALVACLAADALGPERVSATIMPSRYSSSGTQQDARELAARLGVRAHELPIEPVMDAYQETLRAEFAGREPDLTEENLQARIRGNLLMALSNKFGWLVLTTGNKSEMSVGYTTLYGDLAGGFAVIKDVPKTLVYRALRVAQLAGRRRRAGAAPLPGAAKPDPALDHRARALGRAAPRPARRGLAAALRASSTASCRATSSSTRAASS